MSEPLDPTALVTIEELAISSMREVDALIEPLHEKGLVTKEELLDKITALRRKHPQATTFVDSPRRPTRPPDT